MAKEILKKKTEEAKDQDQHLKKIPDKESKEILNKVTSLLEKKYGKNSVILLGDRKHIEVDTIDLDFVSLNYIFGVKGLPRGRIIEIYGPESSGKTSLALHLISEVQNKGGKCLFVDVEHALDLEYAKRLGVNVDSLLFSQPDYAEQALDIVETMVLSNLIDLVVVDSVAALVPKEEFEGDIHDQSIGLQARMMSKALRRLTSILGKTGTTCIFINQTRQKIGGYGGGETTTGGNALKFYSSIRTEVRVAERLKDNDGFVANKVRITAVKNKLAAPYRKRFVTLEYGIGFDLKADVIDWAVELGIITKSGSWFEYNGQKIQGIDNLISTLSEDDFNNIKNQVKDLFYQNKE